MDETVELVLRDKVTLRKAEAAKTINRGVALILFIPIVIAAAVALTALFDTLWPLLIGALYTIVGALVGGMVLALGIAKHRGATRELREIDAIHQLPVARVVRT